MVEVCQFKIRLNEPATLRKAKIKKMYGSSPSSESRHTLFRKWKNGTKIVVNNFDQGRRLAYECMAQKFAALEAYEENQDVKNQSAQDGSAPKREL